MIISARRVPDILMYVILVCNRILMCSRAFKFKQKSSKYEWDKDCPSELHFFHHWEFIENLLKFNPILELNYKIN